jgi:hypothetical protein
MSLFKHRKPGSAASMGINGFALIIKPAPNPKHEIRNPKWFDKLTTLSQVEGQYLMTKTQMTETMLILTT